MYSLVAKLKPRCLVSYILILMHIFTPLNYVLKIIFDLLKCKTFS